MWLLNDVFLAFFKQEFTKKYISVLQNYMRLNVLLLKD